MVLPSGGPSQGKTPSWGHPTMSLKLGESVVVLHACAQSAWQTCTRGIHVRITPPASVQRVAHTLLLVPGWGVPVARVRAW